MLFHSHGTRVRRGDVARAVALHSLGNPALFEALVCAAPDADIDRFCRYLELAAG
jgi:hypothetical protein